MVAMALDFPGMSVPIPGDESYITALDIDDRQVVYGGTGGRKAHLFAAFTRGLTHVVIDMCVVQEDARTTAVLAGPDGGVFAATAPGGSVAAGEPRNEDGEGAIYTHGAIPTPYDLIHEWHFIVSPAEKLTVPLPGEGIACAILGPGRKRIYGMGERSGTLFACDAATGGTETLAVVDDRGFFSRTIVLGPDRMIYGTGILGKLWRLDPESGLFDWVGAAIPTQAGRAPRNQAESFAVDRARGIIYGAGSADGILFAFDPASGRVRSLGKTTTFRGARGLVVTNDGRLFGISGRQGDIGHLFCYDPDEHELRDLGLLAALRGPRIYGYEFSCGVVDRDGHVFFGQHERGGHLWQYCPAIRRTPPPAGT